jgi:hypothetical protein
MRLFSIFLSIFLFITACTQTLNIYSKPVNRLKLKKAAFKEFAYIAYKNGQLERVLITKVTEDSLTIVNLDNKSIDPLIKTIPFNDIELIKVFEEKDGDYVIYTFDKAEKWPH